MGEQQRASCCLWDTIYLPPVETSWRFWVWWIWGDIGELAILQSEVEGIDDISGSTSRVGGEKGEGVTEDETEAAPTKGAEDQLIREKEKE